MEVKPNFSSSYMRNSYGDLFYGLVKVMQPELIVELGTSSGYSAHHMARALKENQKGRINCYDLWEMYEHRGNTCDKASVIINLKQFIDDNIIYLNQGDVRGLEAEYGDGVVDILHIDL